MNSHKLKASEQRQQQCEDLRRCLSALDTGLLLVLFRAQAASHFDGHYTILSFTTHFKAAFGTPALDWDGHEDVAALPGFATLKDAVIDALVGVRTFYQEAERDAIRVQLMARLQETGQ
jgi:hypothetical protein